MRKSHCQQNKRITIPVSQWKEYSKKYWFQENMRCWPLYQDLCTYTQFCLLVCSFLTSTWKTAALKLSTWLNSGLFFCMLLSSNTFNDPRYRDETGEVDGTAFPFLFKCMKVEDLGKYQDTNTLMIFPFIAAHTKYCSSYFHAYQKLLWFFFYMHLTGDWGKEKELTSFKFTNYLHVHLKSSFFLQTVKTPVTY